MIKTIMLNFIRGNIISNIMIKYRINYRSNSKIKYRGIICVCIGRSNMIIIRSIYIVKISCKFIKYLILFYWGYLK